MSAMAESIDSLLRFSGNMLRGFTAVEQVVLKDKAVVITPSLLMLQGGRRLEIRGADKAEEMKVTAALERRRKLCECENNRRLQQVAT
jgi:hypothetical protein